MDPTIGKLIFNAKRQNLEIPAIIIASLMTVSIWWRGGSDEKKKECDRKKDSLLHQLGDQVLKFGDVVAEYRIFEQWFCFDDCQEFATLLSQSSEGDAVVDYKGNSTTIPVGIDEDLIKLKEMTMGVSSIDTFLTMDAGQEGEEDTDTFSIGNLSRDSFSDVSESDTASSNFESQEEALLSTIHMDKKRRKWCSDNSLNSKSLLIALSTAKDWATMMKVKITKDSIKQIQNEEIPKLLFSAFFQNVCSKSVEDNQYCCLLQGIQGFIHPSSCFKNQRNQFVIYHDLLHTYKSFLTRITPVEYSWLHEVLPAEIIDDFEKQIVQNRKVSEAITVARCILLKLTGKYNSYVSDLEEQMNAVLELDTVLQSITIWTVESNMAKAKQILEKNLEKVIAQLENEVHEETIVGSTRALFGKGASLQNLLLERESLQLIFTQLPKNISKAALFKHINYELQSSLNLDDEIYECEIFPPSQDTFYSSGKIMFKDVNLAKTVEVKLNNSLLNGKTIRCELPLGKGGEVHEKNFLLKWPEGRASGKAYILYTTAQGANKALEAAVRDSDVTSKEWRVSPPEKLTLPFANGKYLLPNSKYKEQDKKKKYQSKEFRILVEFNNKSSQIPTEIELFNCFSKYGCIHQCQIKRFTKSSIAPTGPSTLAKLFSLVSRGSKDSVDCFANSFDLLTGRSMVFDDLESAIAAVVAVNTSSLRFHFQKPQAELKYSTFIHLSSHLYLSLASDLLTCTTYAQSLGISVKSIEKSATQTSLQITSLIHCPTIDENTLQIKKHNSIVEVFRRLLTSEKYKHAKSADLFTFHGAKKLASLGRKKYAYIHTTPLDHSVYLYGPFEKIEQTKLALNDYLNETEQSVPLTLFYPLKNATLVRKSLASFCKNESILRILHKPKEQSILFYINPAQSGNIFFDEKYEFTTDASPPMDKVFIAGGNYCPICFTADDEASMIVLHCGHRYHDDCFHTKMNPEDASILQLPIQCDTCQKPLIWQDICSYLSEKIIHRIMKISFRKYVLNNQDNYIPCFGVNCDQIFLSNNKEKYCDICNTTYCLPCSIKQQSGIPIHPERPCVDPEPIHLEDFGASPCPSCKAPIQKSEGCYHMKCSQCKTHFCWGCMLVKSHRPSDCSCHTTDRNHCMFIYHHIDVCKRPVHP